MESYYSKHFGKEHYSPSTLNLFSTCPSMFVLTKCYGIKTQVGAAAHRGTSVEAGVLHFLTHGKTDTAMDEGINIAKKQFAQLTALTTDHNREKEGEAVPEIVKEAGKLLATFGELTAWQIEVRKEIESIPLPIMGYLDFAFEGSKYVIDLKTQLRLASEITTSHARQGALYSECLGEGWTAGICYATPKKSHVLKVEEPKRHLDTLANIALRLEKFCSISSDPKELAALVAPDFDSFYWNDPAARREGFRIWGY